MLGEFGEAHIPQAMELTQSIATILGELISQPD